MVIATHEVVIDLDGDGVFNDAEVTDDISDFGAVGARLISSTRGRDQARLLSQGRAGSAGTELDNQSGDYDPDTDLTEGQAFRWRATDPADSSVIDIFTGVLDAVEQAPGAGLEHRVRVPVKGNLSRLVGRRITTELYTDETTGALIGRVLDAAGWTGTRHLDDGQTTLPQRWWRDEDAWAAIQRLVNSEGPGAALYEDGSGAIVFKGRHAVLTETRSNTSQTTFSTAAGASEPRASGWRYDPSLRDRIRRCEVQVVRRSAKSLAEVWALGTTITLAPGEVWTKDATFADGAPVTGAVAPNTGDGDYVVNTGSVASVVLNRTSGAAIGITITAGTEPTEIDDLRLRAQLVSVDGTTTVRDQQGLSGGDESSYVLPVYAEIDVQEAQDFCDAVVGYYQDGRPRGEIVIEANASAERMTAALTRDVNDRVRVVDGMTGTDKQYIVHQIAHDVTSPNRLRTTLGVEEALPGNYFFRLGHGQFGVGRMGY